MAPKPIVDDKANTPVQGAEGAAEQHQPGIQSEIEMGAKSPVPEEQPAELLTAETPEWVQTILESNAQLIASNEAVIAGLQSFKQHAAEFVTEIAERTISRSGEGEPVITRKTEKQVDLTADYVVATGKSFRDSKDFSKVYSEGESVSGLDENRLKNLLNQGLIELSPTE